MALRILWSEHAARQLQEAALYLEEARPGIGRQFIDAVEAALAVAARFPQAGPHILGEPANTRKTVLTRYGYWIIY